MLITSTTCYTIVEYHDIALSEGGYYDVGG